MKRMKGMTGSREVVADGAEKNEWHTAKWVVKVSVWAGDF